MPRKIAFSNDHAALEQRPAILDYLKKHGYEVIDFGAATADSVDYPDFAAPAVRALQAGEVDAAILMCGSGIGMSMAANRYRGVRCALATDLFAAEMSRRHNDANCLALRARNQPLDLNLQILETWLATPFEGGRHQRRVERLDSLSDHSNISNQSQGSQG
jgi:ribose 5-phosphate isomerase B